MDEYGTAVTPQSSHLAEDLREFMEHNCKHIRFRFMTRGNKLELNTITVVVAVFNLSGQGPG